MRGCPPDRINSSMLQWLFKHLDRTKCPLDEKQFGILMDMHTLAMMLAMKQFFRDKLPKEQVKETYMQCLNMLRCGACPNGKIRILRKGRKRTYMKKAGKIIIGAVVAAAVVGLVAFRMMKTEPPIEAVPDPTVEVAAPQKGTIELNTGLTGTVEPSDVVYVIPKGAGEVLEVYVSVGQTVERISRFLKSTTSSSMRQKSPWTAPASP